MPRVRVIHWKAYEAPPLLEACRAAGWETEFEPDPIGGVVARGIRKNPPDAVVIDLSRLPSHGREVAIWLRGNKRLRHIPLLFVNGEPAKAAGIKQLLPDAVFTDTAGIAQALQSAQPLDHAISPPPMMERYGTKTVAQKLGIGEAVKVGVIDAPRDYPAAIGDLPEKAELLEDPKGVHPVTVWFIQDMQILVGSLPRMRAIAGRTKLWIAWPKGSRNGVTQNGIREAAIEAGLVDYKICALHGNWSGILFARKKE